MYFENSPFIMYHEKKKIFRTKVKFGLWFILGTVVCFGMIFFLVGLGI